MGARGEVRREEREKGTKCQCFRLFFVSFDGVGKRG